MLQTRGAKRYFGSHAKQTSNLCTINSRDVARLKVGVPDLDEQDEIVRDLEAVDRIMARLEDRQMSLNRLRKSLLEALVSGDTRVETLLRA